MRRLREGVLPLVIVLVAGAAGYLGGLMTPLVLPSPQSLLVSPQDEGGARDRELINRTYTLARSAVEQGNYPFGALLVHEGIVIHEAENAVVTSSDVTQHAELRLISEATRKFDRKTIEESTVYTSTDTCPMCAGAIRFAGLRRLVFGTSVRGMRGFGLRPPTVSVRELYARIAPYVDVVGPVAEEEGVALHREAWPEIRRREDGKE